MASTTYYEFPAKGARPAVKMIWYDGGLTPPKPVEMGEEEFNKGGGMLFIGTKGKLLHDTYGFNPRLLPKSLHEVDGKPKETYARIKTSHEMNWIDAIRGTQKTSSPFEYSAKLTEIMLLGVVALNAGKKIEYDGAAMKIKNVPDSDALLKRAYREGWTQLNPENDSHARTAAGISLNSRHRSAPALVGALSSALAARSAPASPAGKNLRENSHATPIAAAMRRIQPLFLRKLPPHPGDWLAEHKEAGHDLSSIPHDSAGARDRFVYDAAHRADRAAHGRPAGRALGGHGHHESRSSACPSRWIRRWRSTAFPPTRSASCVSKVRGNPHYLSLNAALMARRTPGDAAVLGITALDLWPGPGWNFVFGQVSLRERVGVWSMARNGDPDESFGNAQTVRNPHGA